MKRSAEEVLFAVTGLRVGPFYRAFRQACAPPMVRIDTLDVGDLWFYHGLSAMVTSCVGQQSLLVAYDTYGPRDDVLANFRAAHAWLDAERPDPPPELHLVFAAREEPSGNVLVRCLKPGDWSGIPANVPLPPTERDHPPGWRGRGDDLGEAG
jgi:hypothetical protein